MREPVSLLLIEDDEVDLEVMMTVFRELGSQRAVFHARDGIEALELLRRCDQRGKESLIRPIVLLSDLRMPRMGGIAFLAELRRDAALRHLPTFMLSTSSADRDIVEAYQFNVAGYFTKSEDMAHMRDIGMLIEEYCRLAEVPPFIPPARSS